MSAARVPFKDALRPRPIATTSPVSELVIRLSVTT
jgi:hypothetical protein